MTTTSRREIPFQGVRMRFDSTKSFDEVVRALLAVTCPQKPHVH